MKQNKKQVEADLNHGCIVKTCKLTTWFQFCLADNAAVLKAAFPNIPLVGWLNPKFKDQACISGQSLMIQITTLRIINKLEYIYNKQFQNKISFQYFTFKNYFKMSGIPCPRR